MWYITTDLKHCENTGGLGGLGHVFYDVLTGYIIGKLFNIEHVHYPLKTASTAKHKKSESSEKLEWEEFFNLGKDEKLWSNIPENYKKIYIPFIQPFHSYAYYALKDYFQHFNRSDDILFLVGGSSRVFLNELYFWCKNGIVDSSIYDNLLLELKNKCTYKPTLKKGEIVFHIRRGDIEIQPLSYSKNILTQILKHKSIDKIHIISLGTEKQMDEIKTEFQQFHCHFYLNTATLESFKLMMDADILVTGQSSFSKLAGFYSDNLKITLPFNEPCLSFKHDFQGSELEKYGDNWVMADINGNFNLKDLD
jgi:hypothetical protein